MNTSYQQLGIFALGALAQVLFGIRVFVQWWISEKAKKVTSPDLFWFTSLVASALFMLYGALRSDLVIVFWQVVSYAIYLRNLQLKGAWSRLPIAIKTLALLIPVIVVGWSVRYGRFDAQLTLVAFTVPVLVGWAGQFLQSFRFAVQLYHAEKHQTSTLPYSFWLISIAGSALTLIYAWLRSDPVLFAAQALTLVLSIRNIILLKAF